MASNGTPPSRHAWGPRESLPEVIESIGGELELRPLLTRIVRAACALLQSPAGAIALYDETRGVLRREAVQGLAEPERPAEIGPGVGLAGEVMETRRPTVRESGGAVPPLYPEALDYAAVGVPILWGEQLLGCFSVAGPRRFESHDVETLSVFARHAALAIQNSRRYEWERRRTERLALIARVSQIITSGLELDEVLQRAADAIHKLLGYPNIATAIMDARDPETLTMRHVAGELKPYFPGEYRLPIGQGIVGAAARERRAQLVNDVTRDPRYVPWPTETPSGGLPMRVRTIRAELAVPILLGGELLGVLNVESAAPFSLEDVTSLQVIADHLAVAIRNARLYQAQRRRSERLALIARVGQIITSGLELDEVLQRAADSIHDLLGYPKIAIPLIDPADPATLVIDTTAGHYEGLARGTRQAVATGIMGAAAREKRVQLVNDVRSDPRYFPAPGSEQVRAELAIPILWGEQVLGVLNVEGPDPFSEEDATSLRIVADHLAVAIRNARLYESAQELAVLEDRQRLARDLHDSVTQQLFALMVLAQSVGAACRRDPAEAEAEANRLVELTRSALSEMRALLAQLRPPQATAARSESAGAPPGRADLAAALMRHARTLAGAEIRVELDASAYSPQPPESEEALYRIAQEALSNATKHARAARVAITLEVRGEEVRLRISDDGQGFDPAAPRARAAASGLGLVGMRERALGLGGDLVVESHPGAGTTVLAVLPARRGGAA